MDDLLHQIGGPPLSKTMVGPQQLTSNLHGATYKRVGPAQRSRNGLGLSRQAVAESFGDSFGLRVHLQFVVDVTQVKLDRVD